MNERIKLLALQADEYAKQTVHYYMGQFDGLTWEGKIKQTRDTKFTELIVKECAEIGDGYDNETKYNQGLIDIQTAGDEIRKHFGVEE